MDKMRTGICLIFEWENGAGFTGTGMPKASSGEKWIKWELGFALILTGKMELVLLGMGCLRCEWGKMNKMGLGFALFLSGKKALAFL